MAYPGRQNIYEATIRRMVREALAQQEDSFRQQHEGDTEEQLLAYLRSWAIRHHHTPWPEEILGGTFLTERFGSWENALAAAKLAKPRGEKRIGTFLRVKQEEQRQKEIYHQKKVEKRDLAEQRRQQQAARKKESKLRHVYPPAHTLFGRPPDCALGGFYPPQCRLISRRH